MSAPVTPRGPGRPYDPAARRRGKRAGRERGCWIYLPAVELEAAGFDPGIGPPWYRLVGHRRSARAGTVLVSLYREP